MDRVALAYARWLASREDISLTPVISWRGRFGAIPLDAFSNLVAALETTWRGAEEETEVTDRILDDLSAPLRREALRAAAVAQEGSSGRPDWRVFERFWRTRRQPATPPGCLYVNVAHSALEQPQVLSRLASAGARCVLFIHDLIPLTHPEFCRPGEEERHERRMVTALNHADLILANSQTTANELSAYANRAGLACPPVQAAPLGIEPYFLSAAPWEARNPYFVCVGTIEARKNLPLLLTAWRRLGERWGDAAPHLVLIGRRGWENEAVLDHLERSPHVRRLVHEVAGLSDAGLHRLLRGARALLSPSFVEGFNLPVMEALAMGVPVIASDIPVHRELAHGARLIDPLDGPAWVRAIETASQQPCRVKADTDFIAPTWEAHFRLVADKLGLEEDPR